MKKYPLAGKGQKLWQKAKTLIPGGNQLLSKRAEMFLPDNWPAYYSKAKGAYIWDLEGRKYLDMSIMGIGACALGYADPDVNKAVINAVKHGSMATWNAPEEVELAELLCKIHPWADMVRYARTGGESMAIAARIARAHTGRDIIAFCGYHGWSDWYLATNLKDPSGLNEHLLSGLEPKGVPQGLRGTILPFHYNKIEELEKIVSENKGKVAAIIMEPVHGHQPKGRFLQEVREIATREEAVLVMDEVSAGWKLIWGGAHLLYGIEPDMAIFSKSISNGYPMAAIIGRREVMQSAQDTFISSTYWTERIGPVAALATIKKMKRVGLASKIKKLWEETLRIWHEQAAAHGIEIKANEVAMSATFSFVGDDAQAAKTLFTQEMLRKGILASTLFYPSAAHGQKEMRRYEKAVSEVFGIIAEARKKDGVKSLLKGPVSHSHFARLN